MGSVVLKVAAKAVIVDDDRVLIVREADSYDEGTNIGKWGLPGGRIGDDEGFYDVLAREVQEETSLRVEPLRPVYVGEWWPVIKGVPHHIVAMYIRCQPLSNDVVLSEEHDSHAWVSLEELPTYQIMSPDDHAIACVFNEVKG